MAKTINEKTKVVGVQTYLNLSTGELVEMNVIESKSSDFKFEKIWFRLGCLGSKKIKVVTWVLENKDSKNIIIATQRKIADSCKVSLQTVAECNKNINSL